MLYTPDLELIRERVQRLMDKRANKGRPLSQAEIARAIGMSNASVSHFLNHKEQGDVEKIAGLLQPFVEREEAKDEGGLLKIPFVPTRQAKRVLEAIKFCHRFGRMGALIGPAGGGKTRAVEEAQRQDRSIIVVQVWSRMGDAGLLQEICEYIKVHPTGKMNALMKRIKARLTDSGRLLIVDDAHTLTFSALDALRHIYDQTGIGVLLVGINVLRRHLVGTNEELEQIASRVSGRVWELPDVNEGDVELILRAVMREDLIDTAMEMLRKDPEVLSSARRMGNFLEIAGQLAKKMGGQISIENVRQALRLTVS